MTICGDLHILSQLFGLQNISLIPLFADTTISLPQGIRVTPFTVPHRDEFSETVGYKIEGPNASALFIPDIDKWEKWDRSIVEEIERVDYAFLDATFYSLDELPHRDISEIPHPLVTETMALFENESKEVRQKVVFIHFNHTNPLHHLDSREAEIVADKGYRIGRRGMTFEL